MYLVMYCCVILFYKIKVRFIVLYDDLYIFILFVVFKVIWKGKN